MTYPLVDPLAVDGLKAMLGDCQHHLDVLKLRFANVEAANADAEASLDWVVLDNLRMVPERIGLLHLSAGRLLVAVEQVAEAAAHARLRLR